MPTASGDIDKTIRDFVDPTGEIHKSVSAPDMMGETASPPPQAEPEVPEAPPPEEAAQLALPTIGGPILPAPREPAEAPRSPRPNPGRTADRGRNRVRYEGRRTRRR